MNYNSILLRDNLAPLGIGVTDEQAAALDRFAGMLTEKNRVMNLTAITDPDGIAVKHFADSLSPLAEIDLTDGASLLDIGTGAGFPGVPLLIANPGAPVTFLDSTAKKLDFISASLDSLGLSASFICDRAETAGRDGKYREGFDIVISRAVAPLNVLSELAIPFVRKGGLFIAMKGLKAAEELISGEEAANLLGAVLLKDRKIELTDGERHLLIFKKTGKTPAGYPRSGGAIKKNPLGGAK